MPLSQWKAESQRTREDLLLHRYWQEVGGIIYAEVVIGGKGQHDNNPTGSHIRRIDAVRFELPGIVITNGIVIFAKAPREFEKALACAVKTEVIEIKRRLGRYVFGQVIAGADLMEMEYGLKNVGQIILCETGDPLLEKICEKHGIVVRQISHPDAAPA